ncbi:MAG TPA: flagellar biosynthetic protein FliQ [Anaerohalosphaeraceae bacterium]|nr:flagellar biosynthetic protein FliQ [Anaerohalosphaeraceae bacterium]
MTADYILYLGRHTMETALLVSAPILIVCAGLGILISLFQTVTSIRDMTLATAPKIIGVGVTTLFFGHWMLQILIKFTYEIFAQIQTYGQ